jgi:hypothetical protein
MENKVKAKFKCGSVTEFDSGGKEVKLQAVAGPGNEDFTRFTPLGELRIQVTSETPAVDFFKPGKVYDLLISETKG